jgi:hypothetical protein
MPKANPIFNREITLRALTRAARGKLTTAARLPAVATTADAGVPTKAQPDFLSTTRQ